MLEKYASRGSTLGFATHAASIIKSFGCTNWTVLQHGQVSAVLSNIKHLTLEFSGRRKAQLLTVRWNDMLGFKPVLLVEIEQMMAVDFT